MKKLITIADTLPQIKKIYSYTNKQLADIFSIDERTLSNYKEGSVPSAKVFNAIKNYIESNNLDIFSLLNLDDNKGSYLFHGSRNGIKGIISTKVSKERLKDFGDGFYLSESFKTAITYVDNQDNPHIYRFKRNSILKKKSYVFSNNENDIIDWVLYIALNRKKIPDKKVETFLNEYFSNKFKDCHLLIGRIADSFNFEVMSEFFFDINDIFQVKNALQMVDIGNQIVIIDENDANSLKEYDEFTIEPRLLNYIHSLHSEFSNKIKTMNKNIISKDSTLDNYRFSSIIKMMVDKNGFRREE